MNTPAYEQTQALTTFPRI